MSKATIVIRALSIASILAAVSLSVWRSVDAPESDREPVAAPDVDHRELAAQLDQVERDILDGEFERARRRLEAVSGTLDDSSALRERARDSRLHLEVAESFFDAFSAEQAGDRERALAKYREVTALKPQHAEALAAIERLTAAPAEPMNEAVDSPRPPLRRPLPPATASAVPAPAESPPPADAPATDAASELLPTTRPAERDVFLPVGPMHGTGEEPSP